MKFRHQRTIVLALLSFVVTGSLLMTFVQSSPFQGQVARPVSYVPSNLPAARPQPVARTPDDSGTRVAKRLQERIRNRSGITVDVNTLTRNIRDQRELLSRNVVLTFRSSLDGSEVSTWTGGLVTSAHWLKVQVGIGGVTSSVDQSAIAAEFASASPFTIPAPQHADILDVVKDSQGVWRASTTGLAKTGFEFDPYAIAKILADALANGSAKADITLAAIDSPFMNRSATDLGNLQLLASGHSDFAGSGGGRKANVRKGTNKYLQNVVVAPGEKFSLNKVFSNVPLSEWEMALIIVNGHDLKPAPGGGLCQVATTLYRAVLNAGLPIVTRANHSLYVTYYEKYGVGIDATILPPKQDFVFQNDTPGYLLIQAYTEGDEAFVSMYGTKDGRVASMQGPYFADTAPEGFLIKDRTMSRNEIAWERFIVRADGSEIKETIVSRYNAIPRSLPAKYGHAAAPVQQLAEIGR